MMGQLFRKRSSESIFENGIVRRLAFEQNLIYKKKIRLCRSVCDFFKRKSGLTFLELLVATSLMSMVFVIGWGISNTFTGVKKVRNYEQAIAIAAQAIEAAKAARFRELGTTNDNRKDTLISDFSSAKDLFDGETSEGFVPIVKIDGIEFKREVKILDCPTNIEGFPPLLKLVQVRVTWKDPADYTPMVFEAATAVCDSQ
ncbi:MAG: hypothetical protein HQM08_00030 [Candidatus Riflebacteria bacterium]|nr:hypothetical protein [Candidatus Riflebacteria bacterium]